MVSCLVALALPASARAQTIVDLDPATDTVRVAARLDGALTRPASGTAAAIGLRYVREHRAALGLTAADLETLGDAEVETFAGIRQVRWRQAVDGIEVADAELRVSVADDGRVLSVLGSPSSDLPTDTTPRLGKPDPDAELTIYDDRLAYRYEDAVSRDAIYDVISDADTGRILKRTNLVKSVDADVWDLHPSVGTAKTVSLDPWLLPGATTLQGRWVRAFSDVDGNNAVGSGEEITPGRWPLVTFPGIGCSNAKPCTWSSADKQVNRQQNGNQAFYLANRFHDHLAQAPIDFDEFEGVDRVILETNDGGGLNNANMYTPPDGKSPRMQMYLWANGGYRAFNSGDDASILFHEYTHGLTGRLVKTPDGVGALSSWQAGAMGEGWSDFYAKDFTVSQGLEPDDPDTPGEVDMGVYSDATPKTLRSGALDCPVNVTAAKCPSGGGYTYGDFAKIDNGPEVHYDGEIWAQTLWDLRTAIGSPDALRLVTAALRLSPPEPSFIDMRNAILLADNSGAAPGRFHGAIWRVFAARGMGFYATALSGADIAPVEDFRLPPDDRTPRGSIMGTITDADGTPVAGATVSVGGLETGPDALKAVTTAAGTYTIPEVPVGSFNVVVTAPGYDRGIVESVAVEDGGAGVADTTIRRNWALGATLRSTAGSENAEMGCGPKQAFDGLPGSTWSTAGSGGKELVLQLPETIDVGGFGIDPGAGCGDDERSATKAFQIATGPSASGPWTVAVNQTTALEPHRTTVLPASVRGVTYVRLLPMSTQGTASYIDVSEFAVYSAPRVTNTAFTSTPPAFTRDPVARYAFAGGDTYTCAWDGEPAAPCTSPATRTLTTDGVHRFSVTATGPAGPDPTPAVHEFTLDTAAPQIPSLTRAVDGDAVTFTFAATDATAVTYTCSLDGTPSACTSPKAYTGLSLDTHAFTVTATDAAGNAVSRSLTVNLTPPETTITTKPAAVSRETRPAFAFSGSETYECNLDGAGYMPCPASFGPFDDGSHTLLVRGTIDGRTDPTPAAFTWTVDTTAPTVGISSATADRDVATFTFAATDATAVTYACTFDGAPSACASPQTFTGLADGTHELRVTATDAAGNTTSASRTVIIDVAAPDTSIESAPPTYTGLSQPSFSFAGGESYECRFDDGTFAACTSPHVPPAALPDGHHTFAVRATRDRRTDPTPAVHAFTVDTQAPDLSVASVSVTGRSATIAFAATDATAITYACRLDGQAVACASPQTFTGLADGTHTIQVTATDAVGHASSASRTVTVDATLPETIMAWAPPAILTAREFTFAFTASRPATFLCSVNGGPQWPCDSPLALTGLADGQHSLEVTAIDLLGRADPTPARAEFFVAVPGTPPAATPTPTATPVPTTAPTVTPRPPLALASATGSKTVSRKSGRVKLSLRGTKGARVVVQAKVGSRVVGKATKTLRGATLSVPLTLDKKRLKVGATVTVTLKATGSGMAAASRSLKIRVKA